MRFQGRPVRTCLSTLADYAHKPEKHVVASSSKACHITVSVKHLRSQLQWPFAGPPEACRGKQNPFNEVHDGGCRWAESPTPTWLRLMFIKANRPSWYPWYCFFDSRRRWGFLFNYQMITKRRVFCCCHLFMWVIAYLEKYVVLKVLLSVGGLEKEKGPQSSPERPEQPPGPNACKKLW